MITFSTYINGKQNTQVNITLKKKKMRYEKMLHISQIIRLKMSI